MFIKTILKKIFASLKLHKKKSIFLFAIIVLICGFRYLRSQRQLDAILNKMQEKISAQIEQNLKETEQVRKLVLNVDDLYSHFLSLRPLIKRNLKKEIECTFSIAKIRDDIKQPGITQDRKKELWNQLKLELFTHAVYSLAVVPMANLITYLRDCVVQKYEKELLQDDQAIEMLNDFMNDFTDYIVRNGCRQVYPYLKMVVAPAVEQLSVAASLDIEAIDSKIAELLDIVTKKSAIKSFVKAWESEKDKPTFTDDAGISKILIEGVKPSKAPTLLSKEFYQLTVPEVRTSVVTQFMRLVWNNTPKIDEHFINQYAKNPGSPDSGAKEDPKEGAIKLEEIGSVKTDVSIDNNVCEERKAPDTPNMDPASRLKLVTGIATKVTNELLDLLESKNFDIIVSFSIRYEFLKLKNRLLLFFEKTKAASKMQLANYLMKINQIVNDEFLDENSDQTNEEFYTRRLKLALLQSSDKPEHQSNATEQELLLTYNLLREYEAVNLLSDSIKEFGKRVVLEQYYGKYYETQDQNKEVESKDMEEFLKSISHFTGKEEGVFD